MFFVKNKISTPIQARIIVRLLSCREIPCRIDLVSIAHAVCHTLKVLVILKRIDYVQLLMQVN